MTDTQYSTFDQWMALNQVAGKTHLQLIGYALMKLKKNNGEIYSDEISKVEFTAQEFSRDCKKGSCDYASIKRATNEINELICKLGINFIYTCLYNDITKNCEFYFHKGVDFFLESKHQRLISHKRLNDSLYLRSLFALRLFNYLAKWRYEKSTSFIPIGELKECLGVDAESYARFERFRSCVIDRSLNEINHYTSFNIKYELRSNGIGGKIQSIRFYSESKSL